MPLPTGNVEWPPPGHHGDLRRYREHGAWYKGDPTELANVYGVGTSVVSSRDHIATGAGQNTGGLFSRLARWFWGQQPTPGQAPARLHVPLASDIATTSADLLFAEPPAFVIPAGDGGDTTTQERLDAILDDGVYAALHESAEIAAAYGGVYLTACWDTAVASHALVDVTPPAAAVPTWAHGRLASGIFWCEGGRDGGEVWRHLESHEPGRVVHGLYRGSDDRLGRLMPLTDQPATEGFAGLVDESGAILTGSTLLDTRFVPNMRPNRRHLGSPLGRSDYDGIEPVLDALDEAWSSWMRDLRLGKARIVVPTVYLQSAGRGKGARWDPEQEVYSTLDMLPRPDAPGSTITPVQFKIRVDEHDRTTAALAGQAIRGAGYSRQTFGDTGDVAATATEVVARERRTYTTRGRKIGYYRPELAALVEVLLQIDNAQFGSGVTPVRPMIEWPDGVAIDPEAQARTLQLLTAAEAVSLRTRVAMLHPDWDDTQIGDEVDAIRAEAQIGGPDPAAVLDQIAGAGGTDGG